MTSLSESRIVRFPWDPEHPVRVKVLRETKKVARVRTVEPGPGCYTGEWPVRIAWLEADDAPAGIA